MEIISVLSPSNDTTEEILLAHNVDVIYHPALGRPINEIEAHVWGDIKTYDYMAALRNLLLDVAIGREADYFFSLDSDILLPPNGLINLLAYSSKHPGVTSPAVNMSQLPSEKAWNVMQWSAGGVDRLSVPDTSGQVDVVMAAMLLDNYAMAKCRWKGSNHGEDVGFSLDAHQKAIPLWWVPQVMCSHLMRHYT